MLILYGVTKKLDNSRSKIIFSHTTFKGKINPDRLCAKCGDLGDVLWGGKYCSKCKLLYYHTYITECKFKFNVYKYPDYFDLSLIKQFGWYTPPNRGGNTLGVSRDHLISTNYGFINNIDPKIMSHPANCKIITQSDNSRKHKKCSITLDELMIRIEEFNKKYPNFIGV